MTDGQTARHLANFGLISLLRHGHTALAAVYKWTPATDCRLHSLKLQAANMFGQGVSGSSPALKVQRSRQAMPRISPVNVIWLLSCQLVVGLLTDCTGSGKAGREESGRWWKGRGGEGVQSYVARQKHIP